MVIRAKNNPAITECPIPEFTGWTNYGYWLNGRLLNRAEYRKHFGAVNALRSITTQLPSKVLHRSWRRDMAEKHRAKAHRKPLEASRGMDESRYHIPTLNDLGAL